MLSERLTDIFHFDMGFLFYLMDKYGKDHKESTIASLVIDKMIHETDKNDTIKIL
jgi:hypothetical protein